MASPKRSGTEHGKNKTGLALSVDVSHGKGKDGSQLTMIITLDVAEESYATDAIIGCWAEDLKARIYTWLRTVTLNPAST